MKARDVDGDGADAPEKDRPPYVLQMRGIELVRYGSVWRRSVVNRRALIARVTSDATASLLANEESRHTAFRSTRITAGN